MSFVYLFILQNFLQNVTFMKHGQIIQNAFLYSERDTMRHLVCRIKVIGIRNEEREEMVLKCLKIRK